jgi:hypothetical protein
MRPECGARNGNAESPLAHGRRPLIPASRVVWPAAWELTLTINETLRLLAARADGTLIGIS